jgi:hypothetical protein
VVEVDPISPELALVDPDARAQGLAELSRLEATRVWAPYAPVRLARPQVEPFRRGRSTPVALAVLAYLGLEVMRLVVWGVVLVAVLVVSIVLTVSVG